MNINTYSFYPIDSNMYVILENKKALIIDPCVSEEAKEYLKSEQVKEILVLLTHEHYDHISGVNWLRECFPQVKVFCSEACANGIVKPTRNLSAYYEILFSSKEEEIREYVKNMDVQPYSCQADETYEGRKEWNWEGHKIVMQETPGHSKGSSGILICICFPAIRWLPAMRRFSGCRGAVKKISRILQCRIWSHLIKKSWFIRDTENRRS